jgi:fibronectin type 3 domain-containing protein
MASNKTIVTMICITLVSLVAVGCSNNDSSSPVAAAVDTAPPAVPANLSAAYDDVSGAATITWAENTTDTDLAGFIVTRDSYGVVTTLVASPAQITAFEDASPTLGESTYYVSAVDQAGNESAVASATLVRTADHQPRNRNLD